MQPALGRNFTPEEDAVGGPRVAIISHALWQRSFGGRTDIIGKEIRINALSFNVVGVMPQGYVFPPGSNDPADVWTPFQFDPANPGGRGGHFLYVIGRLKPATTLDQARAAFTASRLTLRSHKTPQYTASGCAHESASIRLMQPDAYARSMGARAARRGKTKLL